MNTEKERLSKMVSHIPVAMLSTLSSEGGIHCRPMVTQKIDEAGSLWFFTSLETGKVSEIEIDPHVNLSYFACDDGTFVSVTGLAQIVKDDSEIRNLWKSSMQSWFPKGVNDPNLALLKVTPEVTEYWDAPEGRMLRL